MDKHIIDTQFELFAFNLRFEKCSKFGQQICQIKKDNKWFVLNDANVPRENNLN